MLISDLSRDLLVGHTYTIKYRGEIRTVTIEGHYTSQHGARFVRVMRERNGKQVYRSYLVRHIEL